MANRNVELLAVGAGPSNLALAVALEELAPELARDTLLLERDEVVSWQRGMLIPGALSQVSFLKDLVTLRDPRSRFSFLSYLQDIGRLEQFVNMGTLLPYRVELAGYLKWVADSLDIVELALGQECVDILPQWAGQRLAGWQAVTAAGDTVRSRYLVIGAGRDARIPGPLRRVAPERMIHSTQYMQRIATLRKDLPYRVAVIGSGQSAAEMFLAVQSDLPECSPTMVFRAIGPANGETSKFINELYFADYVDTFHASRPDARRQMLLEMHRTNYSGLSVGTMDSFYRQVYLDRLSGCGRLRLIPMHDVTGARDDGDEVVLELTDWRNGAVQELHADLVLLGTGYDPEMPAIVRRLAERIGLPEIAVTRDYRLVLAEPSHAACYLQGVNEATHGIGDSLLSLLAHRATTVLQDILEHRAEAHHETPGATPLTASVAAAAH
jgi:L-ornithine N5-monooxygenase